MGPEEYLPSWNRSGILERIIRFVRSASDPSHEHFVPEEDRVAVVDFDGTLALENRGIAVQGWVEMELFRHLILDRFGREQAQGREIPALEAMEKYYRYTEETMEKGTVPFEEKVYWDYYFRMIACAVEGLTIGETCDLLARQMNKIYYADRTFYQSLFKPMVELADYLMKSGFSFYIVSGSNRSAIYAVARELLKMDGKPFPYDHCIGADLALRPRVTEDGMIRMEQTAEYVGINMRYDKCENIARQIGRIPVLAIGNSMGDYEMLRWTGTNPEYPSLSLVFLHDDADREYCYDNGKMLEEARRNRWEVISMKEDLKELYLD